MSEKYYTSSFGQKVVVHPEGTKYNSNEFTATNKEGQLIIFSPDTVFLDPNDESKDMKGLYSTQYIKFITKLSKEAHAITAAFQTLRNAKMVLDDPDTGSQYEYTMEDHKKVISELVTIPFHNSAVLSKRTTQRISAVMISNGFREFLRDISQNAPDALGLVRPDASWSYGKPLPQGNEYVTSKLADVIKYGYIDRTSMQSILSKYTQYLDGGQKSSSYIIDDRMRKYFGSNSDYKSFFYWDNNAQERMVNEGKNGKSALDSIYDYAKKSYEIRSAEGRLSPNESDVTRDAIPNTAAFTLLSFISISSQDLKRQPRVPEDNQIRTQLQGAGFISDAEKSLADLTSDKARNIALNAKYALKGKN